MQGTRDIDEKTTRSDGDRLDPGEAARLLAQTERDAKRQFGFSPPWTTAIMGVIILCAYGALWLSTKGQHPYSGPNLGVVALVYAVVIVSLVTSRQVYSRATAGVSGPSLRQRQREGIAIGLSYLGSPVIQGAMKHYGASHAIVYGIIPAAAPLIIVGSTVLGIAASKGDWRQFGAALVVVIAGIVAAFVGPSGAWLAAGIGLFIAASGYAVTTGDRLIHLTHS
jgi:hypothetical protein